VANGRGGRPPKKADGDWATVTVRVPAWFKNHLLEVSEGYDMSITDYLKALVLRDAPPSDAA